MATYNGAAYLEKQIDSLAAQTRKPDELIICDDGSTDGTVALLDSFRGRSPFPVRILLNPTRLGPTANFEQAIRQCSGKIIALCDQDDIWHPDKLERLLTAVAEPRVGAVFSDADLMDAAGHTLGRRLWTAAGFTPAKRRQAQTGGLFDVLLAYNVVTGATLAFRATYRAQVLPIPRIWVHDGWIALIIAALADVALIPEPLMHYRVHAQQAVGVAAPSVLAALKKVWKDPDAYSTSIRRACTTVADQLGAARAHLAVLSGVHDRERALEHLTAKVDHLRTRANLPQRRLARVGVVAHELLLARYHRYSLGFLSAAGDVVL